MPLINAQKHSFSHYFSRDNKRVISDIIFNVVKEECIAKSRVPINFPPMSALLINKNDFLNACELKTS